MILRKPVKALFFLLLLTLALVPVLQAAHALTHIAPGETGGIAQSSDGRFVGIIASEAEASALLQTRTWTATEFAWTVSLWRRLAYFFQRWHSVFLTKPGDSCYRISAQYLFSPVFLLPTSPAHPLGRNALDFPTADLIERR